MHILKSLSFNTLRAIIKSAPAEIKLTIIVRKDTVPGYIRLNKFSDEQFIQPRICAEASQILLIAEQNLKFCSRPQHKALRNGGKNEKYTAKT